MGVASDVRETSRFESRLAHHGMTDHFARRMAEELQPGIAAGSASWQP
ncbi:MAG: hypothetical protein ABID84_05625 [Chloroflexota bacterium]